MFFLFPQKTVTIESIYKACAEICLLKNFLEWTYPQPGSSHTFYRFCCCFCGGNSAQHHGKSCWCHLTSCLPPLCYILSDPSIHLPLTSSPSLCPSSLRSQHTIPPKLLSLRRWYSQKFQANNSYKTCILSLYHIQGSKQEHPIMLLY